MTNSLNRAQLHGILEPGLREMFESLTDDEIDYVFNLDSLSKTTGRSVVDLLSDRPDIVRKLSGKTFAGNAVSGYASNC